MAILSWLAKHFAFLKKNGESYKEAAQNADINIFQALILWKKGLSQKRHKSIPEMIFQFCFHLIIHFEIYSYIWKSLRAIENNGNNRRNTKNSNFYNLCHKSFPNYTLWPSFEVIDLYI